jgi:hypothetical protein
VWSQKGVESRSSRSQKFLADGMNSADCRALTRVRYDRSPGCWYVLQKKKGNDDGVHAYQCERVVWCCRCNRMEMLRGCALLSWAKRGEETAKGLAGKGKCLGLLKHGSRGRDQESDT